jgi:hypothetical protein
VIEFASTIDELARRIETALAVPAAHSAAA